MPEIQNLSFSYDGTPVFSGLCLSLPDGSRTALLAPSGFGKTTLLRLLEHRQPFESEEHMKHWLLRGAVNESRKLLRSFWRRHAVPLDEWRDAPVFQDPAQSELFQAVMALDAKYRLTIYLYYYEGCSVSETAAALRAKPSTVQTWLQRARARLRRTLSEEEEGEGPEHVRPQIVP